MALWTIFTQCGTVEISSVGTMPQLTATLGGTVLLRCNAVFTPASSAQVSYTWYHMSQPLALQDQTNSVLMISDFRGSDGGEYQCLASTTSCTTARSPAFNVNVVPEVRISGDSSQMVTEGDPFTLTCTATGWPTPLIQWQRLTSGGRVVIQTGGVYTMTAASSSDSGLYECIASNTVSQLPITASVPVQVVAPPVTTGNMMTSASTSDLLLLSNGTNSRDFYIAIGITAGVSLVLGLLSLLFCIITLCINFYFSNAEVAVDPYEDWPDGQQDTEMKAGDQNQLAGNSSARKGGEEDVVIEVVEMEVLDTVAEMEEPLDIVAEAEEPMDMPMYTEDDDERKTVTASEIGEIV